MLVWYQHQKNYLNQRSFSFSVMWQRRWGLVFEHSPPAGGSEQLQSTKRSWLLPLCYSQLLQGEQDHILLRGRGLLLLHLQLSDSGVFTCTSHERSFSQALARYHLHVIASDLLQPDQHLQQNNVFLNQAGVSSSLLVHRVSWPQPQQLPVRSFKHGLGQNLDHYCEQLRHREKRRQQKLRTLKLKQEIRKARVRRNNPAEIPDWSGTGRLPRDTLRMQYLCQAWHLGLHSDFLWECYTQLIIL